MSRHDLVIYGATGFTGTHVLQVLLKSNEKVDFAVSGRSESRLKKALADVGEQLGKDLSGVEVIVANSSDELSLAAMAQRAKVIVNTVGPYRLYGEAVVRAAIENGASHVDISGEPAFLETMQMKYGELAKEKGVYVVGACGWDSIPCDLGVNFLKQNFGGQLNDVETVVQMNSGPSGYAINDGTYQTLILAIANMFTDGLGRIRRSIMPEKIPKSQFGVPKRCKIWYNEKLKGWCLPFLGSDKSIVVRSQYFDYTVCSEPPVAIETYLRVESVIWTLLLALWLSVFALMAKFEFTRKILQNHTDLCSFNMFKKAGPTKKQIEEASFEYWFFGSGWNDKLSADQQHTEKPNKQVIVRCDGPDAGYIATSGCALAAALTVLHDSSSLPKGGGVFTTAAAFKNTHIYDRLQKFGITFRVVETIE